jgi:hypothetical protein
VHHAAIEAVEPLERLAWMSRAERFSEGGAEIFASECVQLELQKKKLEAAMETHGACFSAAADDVVRIGKVAGASWHHAVLNLCKRICGDVRNKAAEHIVTDLQRGKIEPYADLVSELLASPSGERPSQRDITTMLRSQTEEHFWFTTYARLSVRLDEDQLFAIISHQPEDFAEIFSAHCPEDLVDSGEIGLRLEKELPKAHSLYDAENKRSLVAVSDFNRVVGTVHEAVEKSQQAASDGGAAASPVDPSKSAGEPVLPPPIGFLGGVELADALGVHSTQRDAFFQRLMRQRMSLDNDCWHELLNPRPNSPQFLYRVDSPKLRDLAAGYKNKKPT